MKTSKILSILLALALMASLLCVPVLASGEASGAASGEASAEASAEAEAEAEEVDAESSASADEEEAVPADLVEESIDDLKVSSYGALTVDSKRSSVDEGHLYIGYDIIDGELNEDESNWSGSVDVIELNNKVLGEGFTAVKANNSDVTITGTLVTDSDGAKGEYASDFTGTGIAVLANAGSYVKVEDMDFESNGFVRGFAMVYGNGSDSTVLSIENSSILARGNDPLRNCSEGYHNSANTGSMVSSPWVLGIQGGDRTVNVLGTKATFIAKDSYIGSGGWAVVSTDGCSAPNIWILNTELEILSEAKGGMSAGADILGYEDIYGSGYGTLMIGSATTNYIGATVNGATYGSLIMSGGIAKYQGMKAGETYELIDAMTGEVADTYTATEDVPTTINTVFGISAQAAGSATLSEGVVVNAEEAVFLYRGAANDWTLDGAQVSASSGVILQMMDSDDPLVGGFDPFNTYFNQDPGVKTEGYEDSASYAFTTDTAVVPGKTYYMMNENNEYYVVENPVDEGTVAYYEKSAGGSEVTLDLKNGDYEGDVFNGTGYYASPDALTVTIADDASLTGDIALTAIFHGISLEGRDVDQVIAAIDAQNADHATVIGYPEYWDEGAALDDIEYEFLDENFEACDKEDAAYLHFTKFTIAEYFLLGQVEDMVSYNGLSSIDVNVEGEWTVEEESLITYLNIAEGATVYGELVENADGTLTILPSADTIPAGQYGVQHVAAAASASSSASGEASSSASGEASGSASGEAS